MRLATPLVRQSDLKTAVQVRKLAKPLRQDFKAELVGTFEDGPIRLKGNLGSALFRNADLL